jgi:hypothetical protein
MSISLSHLIFNKVKTRDRLSAGRGFLFERHHIAFPHFFTENPLNLRERCKL